jgi:large subunit ribosomal protein L21
MFAVMRSGGKQYRVAQNDIIRVEKLEAKVGATVSLDDVLLVSEGDAVTVGTPAVDGASVVAEVLDQFRAPKVLVFKKKRRKNYRRKQGHRQALTLLRVTEIKASAGKAATKTAAPVKGDRAKTEATSEENG